MLIHLQLICTLLSLGRTMYPWSLSFKTLDRLTYKEALKILVLWLTPEHLRTFGWLLVEFFIVFFFEVDHQVEVKLVLFQFVPLAGLSSYWIIVDPFWVLAEVDEDRVVRIVMFNKAVSFQQKFVVSISVVDQYFLVREDRTGCHHVIVRILKR